MWQDARPVYRQIRDGIVAGIIDGRWGPGDLLPSVRSLAAERSVNPLTVAKAYQELQAAGLVEARKGVGLFVTPAAPALARDSERAAFLADDWPRIRAHIDRLGLDLADLLALRPS